MRLHKGQFQVLRCALAASVVAVLASAPALGAETTHPATAHYVPTMADYLGVYDALQHYRWGVEKHDQAMEESAFWDDAVNIASPSPGQEIRMPLRGGGPPQLLSGPPLPTGGPPPGFAPPPGGTLGPPGPNGGPPPGFVPPAGGGGTVWHLPLDSYIHFESATRATHYEYFLSIYPQPENKEAASDPGSLPNASSYRSSIVGWPGHYEDILEKRNGEWRILQRKSMINQK
jgi:hypothetical protein